jgi:hypothetical protein
MWWLAFAIGRIAVNVAKLPELLIKEFFGAKKGAQSVWGRLDAKRASG